MVLAEIEVRTGRVAPVLTGGQLRLLPPGPGSGYPRWYTRWEIERLIAWERMNYIGGSVCTGDSDSVLLRRSALDLIPERCETGALVLSDHEARLDWPTVDDVFQGMMAVQIHDDCFCRGEI